MTSLKSDTDNQEYGSNEQQRRVPRYPTKNEKDALENDEPKIAGSIGGKSADQPTLIDLENPESVKAALENPDVPGTIKSLLALSRILTVASDAEKDAEAEELLAMNLIPEDVEITEKMEEAARSVRDVILGYRKNYGIIIDVESCEHQVSVTASTGSSSAESITGNLDAYPVADSKLLKKQQEQKAATEAAKAA